MGWARGEKGFQGEWLRYKGSVVWEARGIAFLDRRQPALFFSKGHRSGHLQ